jgi:DNA-binding NtrC family response regulator
MDHEIVPIKLFFVSDNVPDQTNLLTDKFKRLENYYFSDFHSTLAHIHLNPDLIFVISIQESNGISILNFIQKTAELNPSGQIIIVSDIKDLHFALSLIKKGAKDYIENDVFNVEYLTALLEEISAEKWNFEEKNKYGILDKFRELGFIGTGRRMRKMFKLIEDASKADIILLVSGEVGCEQELTAATVHKLSKRQQGSFQHFDLLAFPIELMEFELFGREKDSIAGVLKRKIGIIEAASGGTLCIENIEALPTHLQSRLLRAIREKKFIKPGGQNIVFWNARLIVISSTNLEKAVKQGTLIPELYNAISGLQLRIPALRDRGQEILSIANNYLRNFILRNRLKSFSFSSEAKDALQVYSYPGNLQELKTLVETSALIATTDEISKEDLIFQYKPTIDFLLSEEMTLEQYTEKIISSFLEKYNNDVLLVAKKLNIGKSTIYRMLKAQK